MLVKNVRLVLLRANYPADKHADHSFWISAASTAALARIEDSLLKHWVAGKVLPTYCMLN